MKLLEIGHQFRGYDADGGACRAEVDLANERPPLVVATELPEDPVASIASIANIANMAEYPAAEVKERYLAPTQLLGLQPPLLWIEHYERTAADRRTGLVESRDRVTFDHYRRERTTFARPPGWRYRSGMHRLEPLSPEAFAAALRRYAGDDSLGGTEGRPR